MKVLKTALFFASVYFVARSSSAQDSSLTISAKSQLPQWLAKIPAGSESQYGFLSREEMDNALLGQAIQMITVEKNAQGNYSIKNTKDWRIPIIYRGDFKTLFSFSEINGRYQSIDIGGHLLAKELQGYAQYFANHHLYLLRLYAQQMDFLVVVPSGSSIEEGDYYPLQSASQKIMITQTQSPLSKYNFSQLIAILRQIGNK